MSDRVIIVGGGPAGLETARAYRAAGGGAEVVLLCAEPHLPYQRPPLSKELLRGDASVDELPLESASFFAEQDIDVRLGVRATALDRDARTVRAGDDELGYGALVIATGSVPLRPPIPGAEDPAVHTLRTRDDALALRDAAVPGGRAAVVGAGFIACEAAASLARRGLQTTLVAPEDVPQAPRLGDRAGRLLAAWLAEEEGVDVRWARPSSRVRRASSCSPAAGACTPTSCCWPPASRPRRSWPTRPGSRSRTARSWSTRACAPPTRRSSRWATSRRRSTRPPAGGCTSSTGATRSPTARSPGRVLAGEDATWSTAPGFWSTIGDRVLKHAAWGDGFDAAEVEAEEAGRLVVRYRRGGETVGLLAVGDDDAYAAAQAQLEDR